MEAIPAIHHRKLGAELRRLRHDAGLSGPQLARLLGWSQSKVSRMETAERWPSRADVTHWLDTTDADNRAATAVLALLEEAQAEVTTARIVHRDSPHHRQLRLERFEAAAGRMRQFQPLLIPDILQTSRYAQAYLQAVAFGESRYIDAAVEVQQRRAARFLAPGATATYHAIITEAALRWTTITMEPQALRGTWAALYNASRQRNLTIQVVPTGAPMSALAQCCFSIVNADASQGSVVVVDTPAAEVAFTNERDMRAFERTWDYMLKAALDPQSSAAWLATLVGR